MHHRIIQQLLIGLDHEGLFIDINGIISAIGKFCRQIVTRQRFISQFADQVFRFIGDIGNQMITHQQFGLFQVHFGYAVPSIFVQIIRDCFVIGNKTGKLRADIHRIEQIGLFHQLHPQGKFRLRFQPFSHRQFLVCCKSIVHIRVVTPHQREATQHYPYR